MRIKKIVLGFILFIIISIITFQINGTIKEEDACLCTEILSKESFLSNSNKMPSVKNCIETFENFEKAHQKCIKSFKFNHPEIKMDSLKST
jgi:hypothetical protein